jgi:hypothetical protein
MLDSRLHGNDNLNEMYVMPAKAGIQSHIVRMY